MVLHTIIGEYDVLYAQERELSGYVEKTAPQAVMSTDPRDFLRGTELPKEREREVSEVPEIRKRPK